MHSVALYGRLLARAIATGIHSELQIQRERAREPLQLVTGSSGFSKTITKSTNTRKWAFGDDAYFISRNKAVDVIGRYLASRITGSLFTSVMIDRRTLVYFFAHVLFVLVCKHV